MGWLQRIGAVVLAGCLASGIVLAGQEKEKATEDVKKKETNDDVKKKGKGKDSDKATGTLRILLPAEAILAIDETPTKSVGPERKFVTPALSKRKTYYYTLKWTYPDRGKSVTRMTVVEFKVDKETTIDLRPGSKTNASSRIIYVPTDQDVVEKMLEMAAVTGKDMVYDLGCGDGRIVVTAAKKFKARGVGIDIDPERIRDSLANVEKHQVEKQVEIRQGDALAVPDLSKATVVTLYMLPEFQKKLVPILKRELKPGARIVSHDYDLPGWKADQVANIQGMYRQHILYLYRVAEKKDE